jgi:hypothetical protein
MAGQTATSQSERSVAIHAALDQAAAAINTFHAQVLSSVIEAQAWKIHRDIDGHSSLRDWLCTKYDFHSRTAADLAAIARCARKFSTLSALATAGSARIELVAAAVRRLESTAALRVYAKTPYREPVASPFDPAEQCRTPEDLIGEYCRHTTIKEVHAHIGEIQAALANGDEIIDGLSEQSLQRLDLTELDNGMWALDATLAADTGRMFAKFLTTAVPPPRQEETDEDGVLPPQANRNAEALHQLLAGYGSSPQAATRHGHTATLELVVDIETLQGKDTGRLPRVEGRPVSVAYARLLACEAGVIPSVFDYAAGEAIELGRALRLPNAPLRRKLELEQQGGCAWDGCDRPVAWAEAHHIVHWADGGSTNADNLILLCRFHHGRVHTPGWSVEKTGPGTAVITRHEGHGGDLTAACGCSDWQTDADVEAEFAGDADGIFPTGLYPEEWGPAFKDELAQIAIAAEQRRCERAIRASRAKLRERFKVPGMNVPSGRIGPIVGEPPL